MIYFKKNLYKKIILFLLCISIWNYAEAASIFHFPQVLSRVDGSMIAVWESSSDDAVVISTATYDNIRGIWSEPIILSNSGDNPCRSKLYVNAFGNAVVGWIATSSNGMHVLKAATQLVGDSWTASMTLSSNNYDVQDFDLQLTDLNTTGTVMAIWSVLDPTTNLASLWTSSFSFGGQWSTPTKLIGNP